MLGVIREANTDFYENLMNDVGLQGQADLHEISNAARSISVIGANNAERFGSFANLFASFASTAIAQRFVRNNNPRALLLSSASGALLGSIQGALQLAYTYQNESSSYLVRHITQIGWQMTKSMLIGTVSGLGAAALSPHLSSRMLLFLGAEVLPEVAATEFLQYAAVRVGLEQERHLSGSIAGSIVANSIEEKWGEICIRAC